MKGKQRILIIGTVLMFTGLSLAVAAIFTALPTARAAPGILYAAPGGASSGNCDSWANACTLRYALSKAVSGDEIWVKKGVHYPGTNRTDTFALKNGVALYGGFAGTETQRSQRNWQTNVTILSGDIDQNDINTDGNHIAETPADIQGANAYHVVTGSGTNNTAILDGFTITAGQANGSAYPHYKGGGMLNEGGSPTLSNLVFSGNKADDGGGMYNWKGSPTLSNVVFSSNDEGGMENDESNPTLTDVTFISNTTTYDGGGMHNFESNPTLIRVTFIGNTAGENGGGIYNHTSSPTLTNVTFISNTARYNGGGMYGEDSHPILTHVTFQQNATTYGEGGGMYNDHSSEPTLTDVTFLGNVAGNLGGGMYNSSSDATLTGGAFISNTATYDGGGMYNLESNPTLTDVTFISNTARWGDGGGMYNGASSPTLTNTTFISNSAYYNGGGMCNETYKSNQSRPTLTNVTFSSNTAQQGGGMYNKTCWWMNLNNVTFIGNMAGRGGGMSNYECDPILTGGAFISNTATYDGGGMANEEQSGPGLEDVTFIGNTAGDTGGGIYNSESSPELSNVTFISNTAGFGGGGMWEWAQSASVLINVTFRGNTAPYGGGMYTDQSSPALVNVLFYGNTASQEGGGMQNCNNSPALINVTFSSNTAKQGGGMYNLESSPTLTNVILWGNDAPVGPEILNEDVSTPTISYSDIAGCGGSGAGWDTACGADGGGNIDADPLFVAQANGDLHLQETSPAIDAGNNAAVPADVTTDLDGRPRFVDVPEVSDTGNGTPPIVDMGAYEVQVADTIPPTLPNDPVTGSPLITPTLGITVHTVRPRFDWTDGQDNVGVVSYTLVITQGGSTQWLALVTSWQVTTTVSEYTPTWDLPNGAYAWTVRAYDAAGNASAWAPPGHFAVEVIANRVFLPLVLRNR